MATVFRRKDTPKGKKAKWRARWKNAETGRWQTSIGFVDKQATVAFAERLERRSARRAEGLIDPVEEENRRPVTEHLEEFIATLRHAERSPRYILQMENRIRRIIDETNIQRLSDFDPTRTIEILGELRIKDKPLSGATRNEYIVSLKAFMAWALDACKIDRDPLATLRRLERKALRPRHPRRALTQNELARLLEATLRRPLLEVQKIRTGKNKGKPWGKVSEGVREEKVRVGRERRICYLFAYWVGLRRSEIRALLWDDVDLDTDPPRIHLRAEATKSKRADTQIIHPQLADALRDWRPEDVQPTDNVVSTVPCMNTIRKDLQLAGIPYGDAQIGYADLHAQRMSLSTAMAVRRLSPRVRQAHMRHTDPRLTNNTYMDESLLPIAQELATMPWIPEKSRPSVATAGIPSVSDAAR